MPKFLPWVGFLLCWGLSASLATRCLLNSQNFIHHNGHWFNAQKFLALGAYRSLETEWSRTTLTGNELDLNAWHGYQMLCTRETAPPRKIDFKMKRDGQAALDLIFNYEDHHGSGLRLGPDESFVYDFDASGKFLKKIQLPQIPKLRPGENRLQLAQEGDSLYLQTAGQRILVPQVRFGEGSIGFRGNGRPLSIEQVKVTYQNGETFFEDFHGKDQGRYFYWKNFILIGLIFLGGGLIRARLGGGQSGALGFWRVARAGFVFILLWFVFDSFFLWKMPAPNYLFSPDGPASFAQSLEKVRQVVFYRWNQILGDSGDEMTDTPVKMVRPPVLCAAGARSCVSRPQGMPPKRPGEVRLLLVGGSFFAGGGAATLNETFFVRLFESLSLKFGNSRSLSLLNLSAPLEGDILSYPEIRAGIRGFAPDLILYEIRTDILSRPQLETSLQSLESFKVPSLCFTRFIPKRKALGEAELAEIFREAPCRRYEYSVFLKSLEKEPEGFIYVDQIHLTGFAQQKFADWIEPKILRALAK